MKKTLCIIVAAVVALCAMGISAAAEASAEVYVTIANGGLEIANDKVTVKDLDGDGKLTIDEALFAAHEAYYKGGAAAGYASEMTDYGLSLTKLWGVQNGGSYGYYVNNASAWSLGDEVKSGDFINAFVYQDTKTFSDRYCYFDHNFSTIGGCLYDYYTLYGVYFDENYTAYSAPIADAIITVDGKETKIRTGKDGSVNGLSIPFGESGTYIVSAKSENAILVPAALTVHYNANQQPIPGIDDSVVSEISEVNSPISDAKGGANDDTTPTVTPDSTMSSSTPANPKSGDSSAVLFSCAALVVSCGALVLLNKKK